MYSCQEPSLDWEGGGVSIAVLGSDPVGVQLLGVVFTFSHFLFCMVSTRTTIFAS